MDTLDPDICTLYSHQNTKWDPNSRSIYHLWVDGDFEEGKEVKAEEMKRGGGERCGEEEEGSMICLKVGTPSSAHVLLTWMWAEVPAS